MSDWWHLSPPFFHMKSKCHTSARKMYNARATMCSVYTIIKSYICRATLSSLAGCHYILTWNAFLLTIFLRLCHTVPTRCELWLKISSCQCHYKRLNGSILNHARCRVHVLRSPNNFQAFQLYSDVRRWYVSYWRNICIYIIPGDWFKYVVLNCTIMDSKTVLNIYGANAEINQQWLGHYHGYRCAGSHMCYRVKMHIYSMLH